MARPQETFNKKELEKKRLQKRQEKEQRKEERKANANSGKSFEDMIAYVDENGNITSTPPDQTRKKSIKAEDIVIGSRNIGSSNPVGDARTGTVAFFNTSKGFGFIKDSQSGESIFVHLNALSSPIKENDKVSFEVERGPKGLSATKVTVIQ
ncbi:MAG TPA: cold shock domain-containing protein [Cyclobacteriaceae bacterium]|jgi:cold shock CspA family protein|nr:cold shock domain-containing protein [Cytophagales bacterium]HMR56684.1 cold shock domain-containing protein [Cyclobacteriaceae bacterium]HNT50387.1 cold shock domain-containing protein [Cyclobacteriaceae bacterium]HRE68061.1 cold shock domain-containing protein [Cyclobacteriaceae bacterium]HRF34650.1 cold shock domain-containing protein [Cyclobacteriaceae bacterium]